MKLYSFLFISFMFLVFTACDRNYDDDPNDMQEVNFHLHTNFGHQAITEGIAYELNGRNVMFDYTGLYISGITLHKSDGEDVKLEDVVLLIDHTEANYKGAKVPPGDYTGYTFYFGVIPALNTQDGERAADPSTYPAEHPLAFQSPSMHWSWNSGYIFVRIDGQVDLSAENDGSEWTDMHFHIGTDELLRQGHMHESFTVHQSLPRTLHLDIDFAKLLEDLDLQTENQTKTMNNFDLAEKIADKLPEIVSSH